LKDSSKMKKVIILSFLICCHCGYKVSIKYSERHDLTYFPQTDRFSIVFLYSFSNLTQLGFEPKFFTKVFRLLAGKETESELIAPMGIWSDGNMIAVTDISYKKVVIYDLKKGNVKEISEINGMPLLWPVGVAICNQKIYVTDSARGKIFVNSVNNLKYLKEIDMKKPTGVACYGDTICVSETDAHRIVCFKENKVMEIGKRGELPGEFNYPTYIAFDRRGYLFVVDALNFRVQVFDQAFSFVRLFGEQGDVPGFIASPKGIGVNSEGYIFLTDAIMDIVQIFDGFGNFVGFIGGTGSEEGRLYFPTGLFVDLKETVYVADTYNSRIKVYQCKNKMDVP